MNVGYARTSTVDQNAGLDAQLRDLHGAGCEKVFNEQVSSVAERAELTRAMEFVREGDTFVVTKIDRLARSITDLMGIIERLKAKGVTLRILGSDGLDTNSPIGKMILQVLGIIAEFERAMMLERQREGIAVARAAGKYKGRAPTARRQAPEVVRLHAEGVGASAIAKQLGISRMSVYRCLEGCQEAAD
jgi:DNA invertase Pin-like site-specific DNA recombinase